MNYRAKALTRINEPRSNPCEPQTDRVSGIGMKRHKQQESYYLVTFRLV